MFALTEENVAKNNLSYAAFPSSDNQNLGTKKSGFESLHIDWAFLVQLFSYELLRSNLSSALDVEDFLSGQRQV